MKKHYKMNLKNYILVTLYIISIFMLISESNNLKTLIITKILGSLYFIIFTSKNIIKHR